MSKKKNDMVFGSSSSAAGATIEEFLAAAKAGNTERVLAILREGKIKVNDHDPQCVAALMFAAQYGHEATVDALIAAGADVNAAHAKGWTALMLAAQSGNVAVIERLIEKGAAS